MQPHQRLIVALDSADREATLRLADSLTGSVGWWKIGLQAFVSLGPSFVRELTSRNANVFLDLKLHDIPNTVAQASEAAAALGVGMLTVHAAGGPAMVHAAATHAPNVLVLGVTVLTSLSDADLAAVGLEGTTEAAALRLARMAQTAGAGGVVASPLETGVIREACGPSLRIVTPGVRPAGASKDDQARTLTPAEAIRAGADYLVIGRPITRARNPRDAAQRIVAEIAGAS